MTANHYAALQEEHVPLIKELLGYFTKSELVDLAAKLPFNQRAADAIKPTAIFNNGHWDQGRFLQYLISPDTKPRVVAAYCAAAAQYVLGKCLEALLVLSRQKLATLQEFNALLDMAPVDKLPHLRAALVRDGSKEKANVRD